MVGTVLAMWPWKLPRPRPGGCPRHGSRRPVVFRPRRRKEGREASHGRRSRRCRAAAEHAPRYAAAGPWAHSRAQMVSSPLPPPQGKGDVGRCPRVGFSRPEPDRLVHWSCSAWSGVERQCVYWSSITVMARRRVVAVVGDGDRWSRAKPGGMDVASPRSTTRQHWARPRGAIMGSNEAQRSRSGRPGAPCSWSDVRSTGRLHRRDFSPVLRHARRPHSASTVLVAWPSWPSPHL